jgi:starch synthase
MNKVSSKTTIKKETATKSKEVAQKTPTEVKVVEKQEVALKEKQEIAIKEKQEVATVTDEKPAKTGLNKKVLFVASEAQPFCATGGLADVCGSLPKEIKREDPSIDIRTIIPLYSNIPYCFRKDFKYIGHIYVTLSWRKEYCGVFEYDYEGVKYYFIDNEKYFKRDGGEYGYLDDGERFAFFSRSVLEILPTIDFFPDVIHVNDWQSALIPTYLKTSSWDWRYDKIKTILTIHNILYQGRFGSQILTDVLGIDKKYSGILMYDGDVNILKGAIVTADKVTTVSPSYAEEIKTPEHSGGLAGIVNENAYKLKGILNGLDYDFYNPATDKVIYTNYDKDHMENKAKNKELLQKEFGLDVTPDVPIVAFCSRMNVYKGFDIIKSSIEKLIGELGIQFVGVGSGEREYEDFFRYLNNKYPGKVHVSLGYSLEIGKKIYSGADIYVMPSLTEPCGLSQIVASRYGVIPIVRETGGLKDTIHDFGCIGGGNGYTFASTNTNDFEYSVRRAVNDFKDKENWKQKVKTVMSADFSWKNTAKEYIQTYSEL